MMDKVLVLVIDDLQTPQTALGNENVSILMEYFQIEFWDIRGLNSQWRINKKNFRFEDEKSYKVTYVNNKVDLRKEFIRLKALSVPVAFLFSGKLKWWNRSIFVELKKFRIPYFVRRNKTHPFSGDAKFRLIIANRIKSRRRKLINQLRNWLPVNRLLNFGITQPAKLFVGTLFDLDSINYRHSAKDLVFTHFKDYDNYLRLSSSVQSIEKYIAYVDQYFPFHPELKELKIDADAYYTSVCKFLNLIAEMTGLKVVVCLHPISNQDILEKYFIGFKVIHNKTIEMLSHAQFGIFFNSSTILSCIYLKKPILLIKSNRVLPYQINKINEFYENLLGIESVDIDSKLPVNLIENLPLCKGLTLTKLFDTYVKHPGSEYDFEYNLISRCIFNYL